MQSRLVELATAVLNGGTNNTSLNQQFIAEINNVGKLEECLYLLHESDIFAFVYTNNMIKLIQTG